MPSSLEVLDCPLAGVTLIEASAGTGKTWTICGLYLRAIVEKRIDVRQLLVVTFTKAATAELQERLRRRLAEMVRALADGTTAGADRFVIDYARRLAGGAIKDTSPAEALDSVERALRCFDEAAVYTIHGFCQRALAEAPFAARLPFTLQTLDDDAELVQRAATDFIRLCAAELSDDPDLLALLRPRLTQDNLARELRQRLTRPLTRIEFAFDADRSPFTDYTANYRSARALWLQQRAGIVEALESRLGSLDRRSYKADRVETYAAAWDAILGSPFAAAPAATAMFDKGRHLTRAHLQSKHNRSGPLPEHPFFDLAQQLSDRCEPAGRAVDAAWLGLLQKFLADWPDRVREQKRQARVVGFDDMLYNLWKALAVERLDWLGDALRTRYPVALIDEFQDTDPLQFDIFSRIYRPPGAASLFLVGDPKQAIYGFRSADLFAYLQAAKQTTGSRFTLTVNQRSIAPLIDALNALFTRHDVAFVLPELVYRKVEAAAKDRPPLHDEQPIAPLSLWMIARDDSGKPPPKTRVEALASAATAAEIARLLGGAARIGERPLAPDDIAVIVRTHRQGLAIKRALRRLGIAAVERSQSSVFASDEATALRRFVTALAEPGNEAAQRAALTTSLFGMNGNAIDEEARDAARCAERAAQFADYRQTWLRHGFAPAWRRALDDAQVAVRLLAQPDGERALTNYRHLGELMHAASMRLDGIDATLRWLHRSCNQSGSAEEAQLRLESDAGLVQIVTVHAAKGLEYPVIFCPFAWSDAGHAGDPLRAAFHDTHDRAVIRYGHDNDAARARQSVEELAENLRLIYVALTRAIYRSYLVCGIHASGNDRGTAGTRSALNWLVAGAGHTPGAWLQGDQARFDAIEGAWRQLADDQRESIHLQMLQPVALTSPPMPQPAPPHIAARAATRRLAPSWSITSFTGLNRTAGRHDPAETSPADYDERAAAGYVEDLQAAPSETMLAFPRGAEAGTLMHAAFEYADFADPASWGAAIARACATHATRAAPGDADGVEALTRQLRAGLRNVTTTDLDGAGLCLRQIPRSARLDEMEFTLPALHVDPGRLAALLDNAGLACPELAPAAIDGYLRGAIDCIFRHRGRFWLADWKSNFLGLRCEDYTGDALRAAMRREGYSLQAMLYTLALHRYLQRRIAAYRYARDFGGVLYVFVRGVQPGWQQPDGRPAGIELLRPDESLLAALDRMFAGAAK